MRLPLSKVYRAFPELDRFDDARCDSFVATARRAERGVSTLLVLALIPWCIGGFIVIVFGAFYAFGPLLRNAGYANSSVDWSAIAFLVIPMCGVLAPAFAWLWVRDLWLRRAVARRINVCACVKCHYSLLGLPVVSGAVKCPECGDRQDLASLGLTASDILAAPEILSKK
jgi:hypothetical protein